MRIQQITIEAGATIASKGRSTEKTGGGLTLIHRGEHLALGSIVLVQCDSHCMMITAA